MDNTSLECTVLYFMQCEETQFQRLAEEHLGVTFEKTRCRLPKIITMT